MRNILFAVAFLTVLLSCRDDDNVTVLKKLPDAVELTPVRVLEGKEYMYSGSLAPIAMAGDFIVGNLWRNESAFLLMDGQCRPLAKLGRIGNGPGEFLGHEYGGIISQTDDALSFCILDWEKGTVSRMDVDLHDYGTDVTLLKSFPTMMRAAYQLGDGRWLCSAFNNRYYFCEDGSDSTVWLQGWDEGLNEAIEGQPMYSPPVQTGEVFSGDSSRVLIYDLKHPVLWLHDVRDGRLVKKVYVEKKPKQLIYQANVGDECSFIGAAVAEDHFVLLYQHYDAVRDVYTESDRLLIFNGSLELESVLALQGENKCFLLDPDTKEAVFAGYDYDGFRIYDLSPWI